MALLETAAEKGPVPASFEVDTRKKYLLPLVSLEKNSVRYCAWLSVLYWSSDHHRMVKEEDTSLPASSATCTIYGSSGRDWWQIFSRVSCIVILHGILSNMLIFENFYLTIDACICWHVPKESNCEGRIHERPQKNRWQWKFNALLLCYRRWLRYTSIVQRWDPEEEICRPWRWQQYRCIECTIRVGSTYKCHTVWKSVVPVWLLQGVVAQGAHSTPDARICLLNPLEEYSPWANKLDCKICSHWWGLHRLFVCEYICPCSQLVLCIHSKSIRILACCTKCHIERTCDVDAKGDAASLLCDGVPRRTPAKHHVRIHFYNVCCGRFKISTPPRVIRSLPL